MNMIVAVDKKNGIGKNNKLLAHIKPDLEYYKNTTSGHIIVMGYNTYLSLPKRPLPNRLNIVVTKKDIDFEGAIVVHSIEELLCKIEELKEGREVFICGGASLYKQMMPYADKLYITHIFHTFGADTFFPEIGEEWELENINASKENIFHEYSHVFAVYKRREKKKL